MLNRPFFEVLLEATVYAYDPTEPAPPDCIRFTRPDNG